MYATSDSRNRDHTISSAIFVILARRIVFSLAQPIIPKLRLVRHTSVWPQYCLQADDQSISLLPVSSLPSSSLYNSQFLILNSNDQLLNQTIHRLFGVDVSTLSGSQIQEYEDFLWFLAALVIVEKPTEIPQVFFAWSLSYSLGQSQLQMSDVSRHICFISLERCALFSRVSFLIKYHSYVIQKRHFFVLNGL